MKKTCLLIVSIISLWMPISSVMASSELDRRFEVANIGYLRAWDNMDGLFGDLVSAAYKDYFSQQSRFVLQDLSKSDAVLARSKISYRQLIDDTEILSQIAKSARVESLIRTKVYKDGPQYRVNLEWLHSPRMEIMSAESFTVDEPPDHKPLALDDIKLSMQKALDQMIRKVPFSGRVTGKDDKSVTLAVGQTENLRQGDILQISTLEEVKVHPLLKTIVDWRFIPTGKVEVSDIDGGVVFAKVIEEDPAHPINRFQKVTQIIPAERKPILRGRNRNGEELNTMEKKPEEEDERPTLGWAAVALWPGGYSREYTGVTSSLGKTGGGFMIGAKAEGQLWLTRSWFVELGFGYGSFSYSQQDITDTAVAAAPSTASVSGSVTQFRIDGGYTFFVTDSFVGPKASVRLGYRSTSYSLPSSNRDFTGPSSFKGLFLGLGGDLPIRSEFGALLNFDIGIIKSAEETGFISGTVTGSSDVSFFVGGYYTMSERMKIRLGIDFQANNADFNDTIHLSQKTIAFSPALMFYF